MSEILNFLIFIFVVIILGLLLGWAIAKWKMKRYVKKVDSEINKDSVIKSINEQILEQKLSEMKREVRDNGRRRTNGDGFGGSIRESENPKPRTTISNSVSQSERTNEGQLDLQSDTFTAPGQRDSESERDDGDVEEDWADFS